MEIPAKISVFSPILEIKGNAGTLIAVNEQGFYEVALQVKDRMHTVLFPIAGTVILFSDPRPQAGAEFEVER